MNRGHDRYEALAGALLLGEATASEREAFEAHAAACARCAEDAAAFFPLRETVERASAGEVWRPSISDEILGRVQATKVRHHRRILTTFGYAIAASVVLNVAFVSGFAGRALDALRSVPEYTYSPVGSITLERRAPQIAAASEPSRSKSPKHSAKPRAFARTDHAGAVKTPAGVDVPDVLSGLAIWETGSGERSVASVSDVRCGERAQTAPAVPQPCNSRQP